MSTRIREAMRYGDLSPMGSGGIVEVDETYVGTTDKTRTKRAKHHSLKKNRNRKFRVYCGYSHKNIVLTLVDRAGQTRSFHVDKATKTNLLPILRANLDSEAHVVTDEAGIYKDLDQEYMHAFVNHSRKENGRGEISTNSVEGYYSIFKRGMKGVYQDCSEKHLHRYLAEYDFRYSNRVAKGVNDVLRADIALTGIVAKRLNTKQLVAKSKKST